VPPEKSFSRTRVECPYCGREIVVEHSVWLDYCDIECPKCGRVFYVDLREKKVYTRDAHPDLF